jgi:NADH-quinone oxidoreductase subunit G
MLTIFIDNKPYQVKEGRNLLEACLSLGFDLPYFCWHPAMHSVGACRQCAVKQYKDEKDNRGRIVMSCMTPVAEGLRISIDDPEARAFRSSVIEWLMVNHPHDCPVCDEGGECHLQDMTVMTGHQERRTRFKKRTHKNQDLGPFVNHEMNRCIACYRCVRFYRGHAGGRDLDAFASHDNVYFGRYEDGPLESEFSGNLVEVCPTGVFTDKTLKRHYTRKWDLQTAPSICVHCGLGCNTIPGERYGTLRRILNRYNHEVNGYFLCDRGRFGYEFVNSGRRIRKPLLRTPSSAGGESGMQPVSRDAALEQFRAVFVGSKSIIGIGSPRASLESNFALRTLVGPDHFYSGMSPLDQELALLMAGILQQGPARTPSLHDVEEADAVLILGEDLTNTAPMLDLAVRQSVRNKPKELTERMRIPAWDDNAVRNATQAETGPLYIASNSGTKLDPVSTKTFHSAPADIARLGFAVAHELDPKAPPVPALRETVLKQAREIAQALMNAKRPLIISGPGLGSASIIQAAANIAWSLCANGKAAELCFTTPECNTMGLALMGGKSLTTLFDSPSPLRGEGKGEGEHQIDAVIILENDLYLRADEKSVDAFLSRTKQVIAIDHLINPTSSKAHITLPAAAFAETGGTLVNNEGRAQRYYQVFTPALDIRPSWKWINELMKSTGRPELAGPFSQEDLIAKLASDMPLFSLIKDIAPPADFKTTGLKIPRQPHRYSGRTAMLANINVHEPKPPDDPDSPLSFSMEGYDGRPPAALIQRYWSPGWNSVQALNKFQQEAGGPLRGGDPGIRLIEPGRDASYFPGAPEAFTPRANEWLILPLYHIFGSEELSILSPGIAERAPKPFLALNPDDALRLQATGGKPVELSYAGEKYRIEIKIEATIPRGTAGLRSNRSASAGLFLLRYGSIVKAS